MPGSVRCICRTMKNIRDGILIMDEIDAREMTLTITSSEYSSSDQESSYSSSELE